jgi:predicted enzyme related to lactoylglutathione lyase
MPFLPTAKRCAQLYVSSNTVSGPASPRSKKSGCGRARLLHSIGLGKTCSSDCASIRAQPTGALLRADTRALGSRSVRVAVKDQRRPRRREAKIGQNRGLNPRRRKLVAQNRISAVVCSTDLERSREFYEQKVGLTLSPETIPNHLLFEGGDGTTLLVYGRPSPNLADHTQVRFWCADVAADVRELVGRGVKFDLVEFGDSKMVDHVLTTPVGRSAWFKDPDGNTIQLVEPA